MRPTKSKSTKSCDDCQHFIQASMLPDNREHELLMDGFKGVCLHHLNPEEEEIGIVHPQSTSCMRHEASGRETVEAPCYRVKRATPTIMCDECEMVMSSVRIERRVTDDGVHRFLFSCPEHPLSEDLKGREYKRVRNRAVVMEDVWVGDLRSSDEVML